MKSAIAASSIAKRPHAVRIKNNLSLYSIETTEFRCKSDMIQLRFVAISEIKIMPNNQARVPRGRLFKIFQASSTLRAKSKHSASSKRVALC